jgi:hypothetical protein
MGVPAEKIEKVPYMDSEKIPYERKVMIRIG